MSSFKLRNEQEPANRNLLVKDRQVKYEIDVWHAKPDPVTGRRRAGAQWPQLALVSGRKNSLPIPACSARASSSIRLPVTIVGVTPPGFAARWMTGKEQGEANDDGMIASSTNQRRWACRKTRSRKRYREGNAKKQRRVWIAQ
jgi:hypothetical protein